MRRMQADLGAVGIGHRVPVGLLPEQRAVCGIKGDVIGHGGEPVVDVTVGLDQAVAVAGVAHQQAADLALAEDRFRCGQMSGERQHPGRYAARLALEGLDHLGAVGARVAVVQRVRGRRHEGFGQDHAAGVGDHQQEGQGCDAAQIVQVEPGAALAGVRPQGEELGEETVVDEDAGDQRGQHDDPGGADDPASRHAEQQVGVEVGEEMPAFRFAFVQRFAADGVERFLVQLAGGLAPGDADVRFPLGRQADAPERLVAGVFVQMGFGERDRIARASRVGREFRLHPVADLGFEDSDAAGDEDRNEQPGKDHAAPGMECHQGLAERAHRIDARRYRLAASASGQSRARHAPCAAKAQSSTPRSGSGASCPVKYQTVAFENGSQAQSRTNRLQHRA